MANDAIKKWALYLIIRMYWTRKIYISLFDRTLKEFILVSVRRDKSSFTWHNSTKPVGNSTRTSKMLSVCFRIGGERTGKSNWRKLDFREFLHLVEYSGKVGQHQEGNLFVWCNYESHDLSEEDAYETCTGFFRRISRTIWRWRRFRLLNRKRTIRPIGICKTLFWPFRLYSWFVYDWLLYW